MKVCTHCNIDKPEGSFYKNDKNRLDSWCKQCRSIVNCNRKKDRRLRDPDWAREDRERSARFRKLHPEKSKYAVRNATLKKKYGIGIKEYEELLAAQNNKCAICGSETAKISWSPRLHVDHCHETGRIRGLLCQACNTVLGKMNESPSLLRKAAAYLEK